MSQLELFSTTREELAPPIAKARTTDGAREGERLKRLGMELAAASKEHLLGRAREYAHDIAHGVEPHADGKRAASGLCTADDVAAAWERDNDRREREGLPRVPWIGNAAGSIFTSGNWEWTGEFTKSARANAHANLLRVWKWNPSTGKE